jgi:signal transduction histidine kinase
MSEMSGLSISRLQPVQRSGVRRSRILGLFTLAALAVMVAVTVGALLVSQQAGAQEAIADARSKTRLLAASAMRDVPAGLLTGDPEAIAAVDETVREAVLGPDVARVKVWSADGTIVYSDEARLIGTTYSLGDEEREVLENGGIEAEPSDLTKPENRYEQSVGHMLEVYLPVTLDDGTPVLFEVYYRFDAVDQSAQRIWWRFAPIIIGGLLLLALLELPLAWWLATRIKRDEVEKAELLQSAIDASENERHRIAADLHDGVIQDLTGISYSLAAAASSIPDPTVAEAVGSAAASTRTSISALRSLLIEIYPPNLRDAGLAIALDGLLAGPRTRGIETTLEIDPDLRLPEETEALIFRTAQEALRNVIAHAHAATVEVRVERTGRNSVQLTVDDDGSGLQGIDWRRPASGHAGLRLLADLAVRLGGSLEVRPADPQGTVLTLTLPAEVPR